MGNMRLLFVDLFDCILPQCFSECLLSLLQAIKISADGLYKCSLETKEPRL